MSTSETLEPEVEQTELAETCPRCHTTTEWGENSWCPDCGYYPIVDQGNPEGNSWADRLPDVPDAEVDNRTAMESIPDWFWLMIGGVVAIAVASVAVRLNLLEDEVLRGRIAIVQMGIGFLSAMVAHILAAKFAMLGDRRLSIPDVCFSWFSVWQPTITKLPEGHRRVLAMVWGMIACLTAVTIIGGIDYGYPFRN